MTPIVYPARSSKSKPLSPLLLRYCLGIVCILMNNIFISHAQTACVDTIITPVPDYIGMGYQPYKFYHADGTTATTFYRGETIYTFAPNTAGACRFPNGATYIAPVMPAEATALCTPVTSSQFWLGATFNEMPSVSRKICQRVGATQMMYSQHQKFAITTPGTYNVPFTNSNGTTVNLTIVSRVCVKVDCGSFGGAYEQKGLRNGKVDLFDEDGNELYYENGMWRISGANGIAFQSTSPSDYSENVGMPLAGTGSVLGFGPQTAGTYTVEAVRVAGGCSLAMSGSAIIQMLSKPTISLNTLQQNLAEGNTQTMCDTDANPVNSLVFNVTTTCVVGSPVWRVQVGSGIWSDWETNPPVTQSSNNQPHRYQAACDANCPDTFTSLIEVRINYRAAAAQNVSMIADGTTIAVGEEKVVCDQAGTALTFNATCGAGERLLYSLDGGDYVSTVPSQMVDGQFHNYRVRCQKSDGTASCVESESGVMRLKLVSIPSAPMVSLSSTSSCDAAASFSGQSNCGSLKTVWYNASTNVSLPNFPLTTPTETTSYYARCQTESGCESTKSNVVTFTVAAVNDVPVVTVSSDLVCTGTTVTVSANCPSGSTTLWNTGITTPSFEVAFSNVTKQSYWAKCLYEGGCQGVESARKEVSWKAFVVTLINVGESKSAVKANERSAWSSQFVTRDGGPELDQSTQTNPTLYFAENVNKIAPRFWTINGDACALGTNGSLTFDLLVTPETGVPQSFNTHENNAPNAPYFMYANREGWTELYAQNHPAYGSYQDNGAGRNVYDLGLPKGLYKLGVRYWDQKGGGSIYPSTRKAAGNVLAYQEYWFRIQSKDGVGVGAAREGVIILSPWKGLNPSNFASVLPNPVSTILRLKVEESKGQFKLN